MYQFRILAELLQDLVHYRHTQTQQDFVWPAESVLTNCSPQHSRKTHRESNHRKTSIHGCTQWFYPPKSARWSEIQVHLRRWCCSHSYCPIRVDQREIFKYSRFWHFSILPIFKSQYAYSHPGESRFRSQSHIFLCKLPSQQKNQVYVEWLLFLFIRCQCWSWSRIHSFSYPFFLISLSVSLHSRKQT